MLDSVALLDRAPAGVRRLAYRVAAGQGVLGRWADIARFRFRADDIPSVPAAVEAPVRLLIGPADSAGQAYLWSRAVAAAQPTVAAVSMQGIAPGPFRPDVDLRVPVAVYQRSAEWHRAFEAYLLGETHVIWESGLPLLGRRYGIAAEITELRGRGVQGALVFHGSDIRPPGEHAATSRWSPFREPVGPVRAMEATVAANTGLVATSGLPAFVSTPDLLRWLPAATWCPVVVDPARWRAAAEAAGQPNDRRRPIVVHAPSQRWLKGTDRIEPMLRRLDAEGVIEYRQIVDVPHASMPAFYAGADIVLDQFLLGSYGVAACEALASGRLVMGHVDEFTRAQVLDRTGAEVPVHEATVESLESELRRAAADPDAFAGERSAGPAFVERVHDGRRSASALAPFLGVRA